MTIPKAIKFSLSRRRCRSALVLCPSLIHNATELKTIGQATIIVGAYLVRSDLCPGVDLKETFVYMPRDESVNKKIILYILKKRSIVLQAAGNQLPPRRLPVDGKR